MLILAPPEPRARSRRGIVRGRLGDQPGAADRAHDFRWQSWSAPSLDDHRHAWRGIRTGGRGGCLRGTARASWRDDERSVPTLTKAQPVNRRHPRPKTPAPMTRRHVFSRGHSLPLCRLVAYVRAMACVGLAEPCGVVPLGAVATGHPAAPGLSDDDAWRTWPGHRAGGAHDRAGRTAPQTQPATAAGPRAGEA